MERIIRHFLGDDISFDPARLEETAELLENGGHAATPRGARATEDEDHVSESYSVEPLSTNTMRASTRTLVRRTVVNVGLASQTTRENCRIGISLK